MVTMNYQAHAESCDQDVELHRQRSGIYNFFSHLFLSDHRKLSVATILNAASLAATTEACPFPDIAKGLVSLAGAVHRIRSSPAGVDEVVSDFDRLFYTSRHLPAPPWESAYLSPSRLVMQRPAREVLAEYLRAGVGFDGIGQLPPDHIGRELGFMAFLARESVGAIDTRDDSLLEHLVQAQRRFLSEHILRWVPQFTNDLERAANTDFLKGIARFLKGFTEADGILLSRAG